jgi:hypothetical protein
VADDEWLTNATTCVRLEPPRAKIDPFQLHWRDDDRTDDGYSTTPTSITSDANGELALHTPMHYLARILSLKGGGDMIASTKPTEPVTPAPMLKETTPSSPELLNIETCKADDKRLNTDSTGVQYAATLNEDARCSPIDELALLDVGQSTQPNSSTTVDYDGTILAPCAPVRSTELGSNIGLGSDDNLPPPCWVRQNGRCQRSRTTSSDSHPLLQRRWGHAR